MEALIHPMYIISVRDPFIFNIIPLREGFNVTLNVYSAPNPNLTLSIPDLFLYSCTSGNAQRASRAEALTEQRRRPTSRDVSPM